MGELGRKSKVDSTAISKYLEVFSQMGRLTWCGYCIELARRTSWINQIQIGSNIRFRAENLSQLTACFGNLGFSLECTLRSMGKAIIIMDSQADLDYVWKPYPMNLKSDKGKWIEVFQHILAYVHQKIIAWYGRIGGAMTWFNLLGTQTAITIFLKMICFPNSKVRKTWKYMEVRS